jgi:hypothetical protein
MCESDCAQNTARQVSTRRQRADQSIQRPVGGNRLDNARAVKDQPPACNRVRQDRGIPLKRKEPTDAAVLARALAGSPNGGGFSPIEADEGKAILTAIGYEDFARAQLANRRDLRELAIGHIENGVGRL